MNASIRTAIDLAISKGIRFFAYRKPSETVFRFGAQLDPGFHNDDGFLIRPFAKSDCCGSYCIYRQLTETELLATEISSANDIGEIIEQETSYSDYLQSAHSCIQLLQSGILRKIVLSRTIVRDYSDKTKSKWSLFLEKIAAAYPSAFIFIFYTPETGAWAGASPEILGTYHTPNFSTMALAGTHVANDPKPWSSKDIDEQEYVVKYIAALFDSHKIPYTVSSKYARNAGNVEHLCNDFHASIPNRETAEQIINELHPTPALAGIPKTEAIRHILKTEAHNRTCYGGYIGPFDSSGFDFYVNLRSLKFSKSKYVLYAGGGLTKDSVAEAEWQETEEKSKTLLSFL